MANIREIHERVASIQQILKITNAMYLISSSKLKKARKALDASTPYFDKLQETLEDILEHTPETRQRYFNKRLEIPEEKRKKGYVVITSDKGLCGSYNHNVLNHTEAELAKAVENNCYLFILGQVGRIYFQHRNNDVDHSTIDSEFLYTTQNPTLYRARDIAEIILDKFVKHELDDVYLIYTDMDSKGVFQPKTVQILPFKRIHFGLDKKDGKIKKLPKAEFVPSAKEVMNYLIPNYTKGLIYGAMAEAFCSEQQARMTAMDSATKSAKDMIRELSLLYNRARQAAITQEITEVVSGATSVEE